MTGVQTTLLRDQAAGAGGVRRHLATVAATLAPLLLLAALAAVCAPASFAAVHGDGDADDRGATPARLDTGRSVLLTTPVAHVLDGALVSGHREHDGDDHSIDPNPSPAPSRQCVAVRAAWDASAAVEVRVELYAAAFVFNPRTTSAVGATSPPAATSRAPPLSA